MLTWWVRQRRLLTSETNADVLAARDGVWQGTVFLERRSPTN
jgi:hypothetical protein